MNSCLGLLRGLIGLAQSALILGGCAGLVIGGPLLSACAQWFLILCVMQFGIILIAAMVGSNE